MGPPDEEPREEHQREEANGDGEEGKPLVPLVAGRNGFSGLPGGAAFDAILFALEPRVKVRGGEESAPTGSGFKC